MLRKLEKLENTFWTSAETEKHQIHVWRKLENTFLETENLKSITKRLGNQVDLIKLDIEGRWYELCNEILDLDLPVKMVHVECEMYFGPAEQEFKKLDELVDRYKKANFKVWTNRILGGTNIELCFDRHE